jgi:hypothetical protein
MNSKRHRRKFTFQSEGKIKWFSVNYTVHFKNGIIDDIRNDYNHSVEKNSECWDYFQGLFQEGKL